MQPTRRFETGLAALLLALYVAFFAWQTPTLFESTLTPAEIDAHLAAMEKHMVAPDEAKRQFVADMRAWGAADDGHPVYMVNLLRYHAALQRWPGGPE